MGHALFGLFFFFWCLFLLHCRFLSEFPFSPSSDAPSLATAGMGRDSGSDTRWQLRFGSGKGQAHPLPPHPITQQPLGHAGGCPNPEMLGRVGSVMGFEAGGGQ